METQAHGLEGLERFSGVGEFAGGLVDGENGDGVAVLAGGEEEFTGGIDDEVARDFSFDGSILNTLEFAGFFIDCENGDAVVAAIGAVNKFAAGMNDDFGRAVARRFLRERGYGLKFGERGFAVVIKAGDSRGEFVDDVDAFVVLGDGEMARA